MTVTARPTSRRPGHAAGALANGVLLWLIHVSARLGRRAVPDRRHDGRPRLDRRGADRRHRRQRRAPRPRPGLAHARRDPGDDGVRAAATARLLQVFPFDLSEGWATVARVVLWLGVVGSVVGLFAAAVSLVRMLHVQSPRRS